MIKKKMITKNVLELLHEYEDIFNIQHFERATHIPRMQIKF